MQWTRNPLLIVLANTAIVSLKMFNDLNIHNATGNVSCKDSAHEMSPVIS